MEDDEKADGQEYPQQTMAVVPVPLSVFSDMIEILQKLPWVEVNKVLMVCGQLQPFQRKVTE